MSHKRDKRRKNNVPQDINASKTSDNNGGNSEQKLGKLTVRCTAVGRNSFLNRKKTDELMQ